MEHYGWDLLDLVVSIVYAPKIKLALDDYTVRDLLCGQMRVKHPVYRSRIYPSVHENKKAKNRHVQQNMVLPWSVIGFCWCTHDWIFAKELT